MSETSEPVPEWAIREAAAFEPHLGTHSYRVGLMEQVARALAAAYARGREDAAKVCEGLAEGRWREPDVFDDERYAARECAAAIRSGGA